MWFAAPCVLCLLFFAILNVYLPHLQEYFNILKLYVPLAALCAAIGFSMYRKITVSEVFFYLLFYFILYAMVTDIFLRSVSFCLPVRGGGGVEVMIPDCLPEQQQTPKQQNT